LFDAISGLQQDRPPTAGDELLTGNEAQDPQQWHSLLWIEGGRPAVRCIGEQAQTSCGIPATRVMIAVR
jgi:hypothetical protein